MDIKRIRYTRTSNGNENRQAASHARQHLNLDGEYGTIEESCIWQENHPGASFDRPAFQALIAFCEANPRPQDDPGFIEMDSPCRFGRLLDGNGDADLAAYTSMFFRLDKVGWRCRFVSILLTGDPMVDSVLTALHAFGLDQRIGGVHGKMKARGIAAARKAGKEEV